MKIRKGFVSNSSTSSFTLVVEKEAWDNIFENELGPIERAVMEAIGYNTKEFGDRMVVVCSFMSGNYDTLEYANFGDIWNRARELGLEGDDIDDDLCNDAVYEARCTATDKLGDAKDSKGRSVAVQADADV